MQRIVVGIGVIRTVVRAPRGPLLELVVGIIVFLMDLVGVVEVTKLPMLVLALGLGAGLGK